MKSPGDTARVGLLAKRYPDARFVYIHRDPISVYHSSRGLWKVVQTHYSMQDVTEEQVDGYIVRTYRKLLTRYLESAIR